VLCDCVPYKMTRGTFFYFFLALDFYICFYPHNPTFTAFAVDRLSFVGH